ncbi:MAG TPA: hypothetical protein VG938_05540 [Verrucomicrobiae bacterium]|jgi:hypothetical protein|nr:hypothetical protein [Verrucomicrobiae bacterium]
MKHHGVWAILVAIQLLAGNARAVDKLQADLIPQTLLRARSDASIPVEVRFRWTGAHILEGCLEVELREENRVLEHYRSGDMALTTGEQTFRMLLPPAVEPFSDGQVEAHLKFVAAHDIYDLDYSILTMPVASERSLAVGWCGARTGSDTQESGLAQSLQFERFAPSQDDSQRQLLMTSLVRLAPEDLPLQPLAYTAFDVMVLSAEGLTAAREGQLHALARWVKGGGSVCVFVGGNLQPQHLAFLNELDESSAGGPTFLADASGNLLPGHEKISCLYSGLGRSVIVNGNAAPDPAVWRRAAAFLWKFRNDQAQAIADLGHWDTKIMEDEYGRPLSQSSSFQDQMTYGASSEQSASFGQELMDQLMPRNVKLIPFGALVGMLTLFLLMIGPVDYFVLGWLGRRRFTWVLFPATSVAFMIATVVMANHYLGWHDQRRSLIVVDLDRDGTALRWNRYELIFAARDKQAVTEVKDALWVALQHRDYLGGDTFRDSGPAAYEGVVPVNFRTSEPIRQWQPKLNRIFSFEPPPVPLLPDWPAVEKAWPNLPAIRADISRNQSFTGEVCVISGTNAVTVDPQSENILHRSMLKQLCVSHSSGFFSLVSQISPTGGQNYEDVRGLDPRSSDSVLAIVTQTGDDIIVYRRFFHGN